ncbi:MAG: transposase [Paludibacteraceae bacterium]|nr:transposase [Paludibacteraceae bacterium]
MKRAFEIRLYPTKAQQKLLNMTFGACRFVYNNVLGLRQSYFNDYGFKDKDLDIMDMLKAFNPWLNEIGSQAICQSINDLNKAYKNWFNSLSKKTKQKTKYPKFKKKSDKQSYRDCMMKKNIFELLDVQNRKITIPKIGKITYRTGYDFSKHRITKVYNITVKKSKTNKYFCSICCECEESEKLPTNNFKIGFDLGLKDFLIDSYGIVIDNPKYFRKSQEKLTKEQRKLSHCVKGSNNYNKQKLKVALIHEKVRNQRKDFQHKISHQLINENQVIVSEDLKPSNMVKNHKLAKSIADASFSTFCNMINYKAKWYGRTYIKVGSFYPSSKLCHCCGYKNTTLTLVDREWVCPNCHTLLDRDKNAALNILDEGLKILNKTGQELPIESVNTENISSLEQKDSTL